MIVMMTIFLMMVVLLATHLHKKNCHLMLGGKKEKDMVCYASYIFLQLHLPCSNLSSYPTYCFRSRSNEGRNKGGRGAAKGLAAAIKRIKTGSQKLKIDFSSRLGGPIGPNARSFVDEVVMFTRKRAPLIGVRKWKDIELNVKNSIALDIMVCRLFNIVAYIFLQLAKYFTF
jgi:hypothetical protein